MNHCNTDVSISRDKFLRDKLVSVSPKIPVVTRPMTYYALPPPPPQPPPVAPAIAIAIIAVKSVLSISGPIITVNELLNHTFLKQSFRLHRSVFVYI